MAPTRKMKFDHVIDTRKHLTLSYHWNYFSKEVRLYEILVKNSFSRTKLRISEISFLPHYTFAPMKILSKETLYSLGNIVSSVSNEFL